MTATAACSIAMPFLRHIRAHLDWFSRRSKATFVGVALLELVALSYGVGIVLQVAFAFPPRADIAALSPAALLVLAVFVSPLAETVAFQFVPIAIVSALGGSPRAQFVAAVVPFAIVHFLRVDVPTGVCAGLIGGSFFYRHLPSLGARLRAHCRAAHDRVAQRIQSVWRRIARLRRGRWARCTNALT